MCWHNVVIDADVATADKMLSGFLRAIGKM